MYDRRSLREVLDSRSRILGREYPIDPWRELAVAVIGEALYDLRYTPLTGKGSHVGCDTRITWKDDARAFFTGPDLDIWAQLTSMEAGQWREIARRLTND
jgi:hypothetical protein